MKDFYTFSEFIIDMFCFATPVKTDILKSIPDYIPLLVCLFAVALLAFSLAQKVINDKFKENKFIAYIIAALVTILSFAFIDKNDWSLIFNVLYIPLIFTIRGLEGGLIGASFKPKTWLWIILPFAGAVAVLYFLIKTSSALPIIVLIWSLFGIIVASYRWVLVLKGRNQFDLNNLSYASIFLIFVSTMLYIPNSNTDMIIFLLTLPLGFVIGLIYQTKWFNELLSKKEQTMHNNAS